MKIAQRVFLDMVGDVKHIEPFKAHFIVRPNYCAPMTSKGLCSRVCENCKPYLQEAIKRFNQSNPRHPFGMLTVILKNQISQYAEDEQARRPLPETKRNEWGEKVEEDAGIKGVADELKRLFNESTPQK